MFNSNIAVLSEMFAVWTDKKIASKLQYQNNLNAVLKDLYRVNGFIFFMFPTVYTIFSTNLVLFMFATVYTVFSTNCFKHIYL